ncbi:hypothetical protein ACP6O2_003559 [Cronobacter dublinensis]
MLKVKAAPGRGAAGAIKSPGSNLPGGYKLNGNTITGPRGGVYSSTGKVDSAGNTIYANNGAYYTFDNGAKFKASSPNSGSQIQQNYQKGKEFENSIYDKIKSDPNFNSPAREVTLETSGGTKVRIDIMAKDKLGNIVCVECKSSPVAPLTPNQKMGFPELEKGGGTVIGKGHPGFEKGTRIPPTKVDIVRPEIPKK